MIETEQFLLITLTSGDIYLLVPTRLLRGISTVSVVTLYLTAKPKSPIAQVPFDFTNIFLDFKSLWAIAGLPKTFQYYMLLNLNLIINFDTLGAHYFHV